MTPPPALTAPEAIDDLDFDLDVAVLTRAVTDNDINACSEATGTGTKYTCLVVTKCVATTPRAFNMCETC
ncbi:hypothetical protein [Nonomuraea sp. NPDC001831]|uniref:hypothetical protein n=1 Tax=Nonomuraea sp. NPDC001831 TaxID=3364340 RepID=UPI0036C7EA02